MFPPRARLGIVSRDGAKPPHPWPSPINPGIGRKSHCYFRKLCRKLPFEFQISHYLSLAEASFKVSSSYSLFFFYSQCPAFKSWENPLANDIGCWLTNIWFRSGLAGMRLKWESKFFNNLLYTVARKTGSRCLLAVSKYTSQNKTPHAVWGIQNTATTRIPQIIRG